jgi:hypothetical protein
MEVEEAPTQQQTDNAATSEEAGAAARTAPVPARGKGLQSEVEESKYNRSAYLYFLKLPLLVEHLY